MTQDETFWTLQTAITHGGGFMNRLAGAALAADADNKAKIFKTWPEIIEKYGPNSALYVRPKNPETPHLHIVDHGGDFNAYKK